MATTVYPGYRARSRAPQRECCRPKKVDEIEGTTHAATGLLLGAGVGLLTSVPHAHGAVMVQNIGHDVMYAFLVAGAALLPDADHPKATFAYTAGPISHGLSHVIAVLSGGHRQGMHSFAGIGFMALATEALGVWFPSRLTWGILAALLAMCVAGGLAATGFARHGLEALLLGCALAAVAVLYVRTDLWWIMALGMALHVLEDMCTGHGTALFWPLSRHRIGGDGRQPARRAPSARRPKSEFQRAKARAVRGPVAPKPPVRPSTAVRPTCPACWTGRCDECRDRACGCPERGADVHQLRPKRRAAGAEAVPVLPPAPEDDPPPF